MSRSIDYTWHKLDPTKSSNGAIYGAYINKFALFEYSSGSVGITGVMTCSSRAEAVSIAANWNHTHPCKGDIDKRITFKAFKQMKA